MKGNGIKKIKMILKPESIKLLLKLNGIMKKDGNYSLKKGVKAIKFILDGEKIAEHDGEFVISTFMPPFPSRAFETYLTAVDNIEDSPFTKHIHSKRTAPISFYLSVTSKCNLNCSHCSEKNRNNKTELNTEQWIETIGKIQDMKTSIVGITGGEPLMRKDIIEIISSIDSRSSSILFTNGYLMTEELALSFKKSGLFGIGISIDSAEEEIHNSNRGNPHSYEKAIEAVKLSVKAGLYTMFQTMVPRSRVNFSEITELAELAKRLGANEIKLLEPIRSGRYLIEKEICEEKVFYDKKTRNDLINIQHELNNCGKYPKISSFPYTESDEKYGCGAGTQHSYINSCGDLYPCDFVPLKFGNVLDKDIAVLWKEMNKAIGNPKRLCFANCMNRHLISSGDFSLPKETGFSKEFCEKNQENDFPGFYRYMQSL